MFAMRPAALCRARHRPYPAGAPVFGQLIGAALAAVALVACREPAPPSTPEAAYFPMVVVFYAPLAYWFVKRRPDDAEPPHVPPAAIAG
jgi:hypothetical protein